MYLLELKDYYVEVNTTNPDIDGIFESSIFENDVIIR